MSGIPNASLLDLIQTTQKNLPDGEFETALQYRNHEVCNRWFTKDKRQEDSGESISRRIQLSTNGTAKHVRLYAKTAINQTDTVSTITAPWVQAQSYYTMERREVLRNRAPAKIIDLVKSRRIAGKLDMAELFEESAWSVPTSSTDDLNPRGLFYWLNFADDGATASSIASNRFAGQTARWRGSGTDLGASGSGTTTVGGIDASTEDKWKTYVDIYASFNDALIKKMRRTFRAIRFHSPIMVDDLKKPAFNNLRIYMGLDQCNDYEDLATKANDNYGPDLAPFHGMTTFKRVPIVDIPQLDSFTVTDGGGNSASPEPIVFVNHTHFFPIVLTGDWMRESEPLTDAEQHNVFTTFYDCSYQYFCNNRRQAGAVLHKAIPGS